jgi:hypothetical protein
VGLESRRGRYGGRRRAETRGGNGISSSTRERDELLREAAYSLCSLSRPGVCPEVLELARESGERDADPFVGRCGRLEGEGDELRRRCSRWVGRVDVRLPWGVGGSSGVRLG